MKIGLFFPSYGDQYVTMTKDLYNDSRLIQEYFEEASCCLDTNFVKLCFASSENELAKTQNAYPALFLTSSSVAALLKNIGIDFSLVGGTGVGEYGALHTAGSLSLPDGLYLLSKLALFFNEELACTAYGSAAISGISDKEVVRLCDQINTLLKKPALYRASKWGATNSTVTGTQEALDQFKTELLALKTDLRPKIKTGSAQAGLFSPLASSLVTSLSPYLTKVDFKDCSLDWVAGTNGTIITDGPTLRKSFLSHMAQPVRIDKMMKTFEQVDCILVPSPGRKSAERLQELYPKKLILPIEAYDDIERVINILDQVKEPEVAQELPNEQEAAITSS